jgi:hypothetical protein
MIVESREDEMSADEKISDDDDEEEEDDVEIDNSNKVMIGKADPDFKPAVEVNLVPDNTNLRRSGR